MHPELTRFIQSWLRVALMALSVVLFTAFLSLPFHLKEPNTLPSALAEVPAEYHLT